MLQLSKSYGGGDGSKLPPSRTLLSRFLYPALPLPVPCSPASRTLLSRFPYPALPLPVPCSPASRTLLSRFPRFYLPAFSKLGRSKHIRII